MRVVLKGIHKVKKRLASGDIKIHYYAWRGGPAIHAKPGTPEFVHSYNDAHSSNRQPRAGTLMTIIAAYKAAPEFTRLAPTSRRAYLIYIKLIEDAFGDLPLAALVDRRVRGEFKIWRNSFADTPRKADYAWTTLARIMSFAKDRGMIAANPCEKGGRLNSYGRPWTADGFRTSWAKACDRAGVTGLTFHDLRGSAVVRLALAEATVPQIATFTGHSLKDVEAILDAHYLGRDIQLAEAAVLKPEARTKL